MRKTLINKQNTRADGKSKRPDALRLKVSEIEFYWFKGIPHLITLSCLELEKVCYLLFISRLHKEPSESLLPSVQAGAEPRLRAMVFPPPTRLVCLWALTAPQKNPWPRIWQINIFLIN